MVPIPGGSCRPGLIKSLVGLTEMIPVEQKTFGLYVEKSDGAVCPVKDFDKLSLSVATRYADTLWRGKYSMIQGNVAVRVVNAENGSVRYKVGGVSDGNSDGNSGDQRRAGVG